MPTCETDSDTLVVITDNTFTRKGGRSLGIIPIHSSSAEHDAMTQKIEVKRN